MARRLFALLALAAQVLAANVHDEAQAKAAAQPKEPRPFPEQRLLVRFSGSPVTRGKVAAQAFSVPSTLHSRVEALSQMPGVVAAKALPHVGLAVVSVASQEAQEKLMEELEDDPTVELVTPDTWVHAFPVDKPPRLRGRAAARQVPDWQSPLDVPLVALKTVWGIYLSVQMDGSLHAYSTTLGSSEEFNIVPAGKGMVALRSQQGNYFTAADSGSIAAWAKAIDATERFKIIYHSDNTVSLLTSTNQYMGVTPDGRILAQGYVVGDAQRFEVINLSGPAQRFPDDPNFPAQWGLYELLGYHIEAPQAWNLFTGNSGASLVVAVIDTGIDYTHEDLKDQMWVNPGEIPGNGIDDDHNGFVDDVHGTDFVNGDGDPMDDQEHGTHVAGIIAASGNNGRGIVGVAWKGVKLMALKFLSDSGGGRTSDAVSAIEYALAHGARIASNSWGGGGSNAALRVAIEGAATAGLLFVAASGNSGTNNDRWPQYPAGYQTAGVISVASVDPGGSLSDFSCFGNTSVDVAAPGNKILSSVPGNAYEALSGTSMACPHVSGLAALVWLYRPQLTALQVRKVLLESVQTVRSLTNMVRTGGLISARLALHNAAACEAAPRPPLTHLPKGLTFQDQDPRIGALSGPVTIHRSVDESDVSYYRVYFVSRAGFPLEALGTVNATGAATLQLQLNRPTGLPPFAWSLVAVSGNGTGEVPVRLGDGSSVPGLPSVVLQDYGKPEYGPRSATWGGDEDPRRNQILGTLWIDRARDEQTVSSYNVYWRNRGGPRLGLATSVPAVGYTQATCTGASCDLIQTRNSNGNVGTAKSPPLPTGGGTASWEEPEQAADALGPPVVYERLNYTGNEFAVISASGPGRVKITRFSTEEVYDWLTIGPKRLSGNLQGLPLEIDLPPGPTSIVWSSDSSICMSGWRFEFRQGGSQAHVRIPAEKSAVLANSLEIVSAYDTTELTDPSHVLYVDLVDFDDSVQAPTQPFTPRELRFLDEAEDEGHVKGILRLLPSSATIRANMLPGALPPVTYYQVEVANANGRPLGLPGMTWSLPAAVSVAQGGYVSPWLTLTIPALTVPPEARLFIARAGNNFGLSSQHVSVPIVDVVCSAPRQVSFSGALSLETVDGNLTFLGAEREDGIVAYMVYWADDADMPGPQLGLLLRCSNSGDRIILALPAGTERLGRGVMVVSVYSSGPAAACGRVYAELPREQRGPGASPQKQKPFNPKKPDANPRWGSGVSPNLGCSGRSLTMEEVKGEPTPRQAAPPRRQNSEPAEVPSALGVLANSEVIWQPPPSETPLSDDRLQAALTLLRRGRVRSAITFPGLNAAVMESPAFTPALRELIARALPGIAAADVLLLQAVGTAQNQTWVQFEVAPGLSGVLQGTPQGPEVRTWQQTLDKVESRLILLSNPSGPARRLAEDLASGDPSGPCMRGGLRAAGCVGAQLAQPQQLLGATARAEETMVVAALEALVAETIQSSP